MNDRVMLNTATMSKFSIPLGRSDALSLREAMSLNPHRRLERDAPPGSLARPRALAAPRELLHARGPGDHLYARSA